MSRISFQLLAFNLLLVFLPAAGLLYLDVYEKELLDAQERSMVQQGRVVAAALSGPEPSTAEAARELLGRLNRRLEARIRVLDSDGRILADTSRLGPRQETGARDGSNPPGRRNWLYRVGGVLYLLPRRLLRAPEPGVEPREPMTADGRMLGSEIRAALAGRYGKAVRTSAGGQRSVTLYSGIPVTAAAEPVGAVLVSQSTFRILQDLYAVRLGIFKVFLGSVLVAIALSLLVSTTIARPLRELSNQAAAILDRRGRLTGWFHGSSRKDEIGELSRALEELTRRLEERLRLTEAFAAEVSHEFKNPLASIRTATEMLSEAEDAAGRRRFLAMAQAEIARLERLLSDLRDVTAIDARLETEAQSPVSLAGLLERICEGFRLRARGPRLLLDPGREDVTVHASADRLAQVFENILDNAVGHSSEGGTVRVTIAKADGAAEVTIADEGPGIPEAHLEKIFDRFFSYRPSASDGAGRHTGLGLAIVKTIVEGYGGKVTARNNPEGGASFMVRLPASRTGVFQKR